MPGGCAPAAEAATIAAVRLAANTVRCTFPADGPIVIRSPSWSPDLLDVLFAVVGNRSVVERHVDVGEQPLDRHLAEHRLALAEGLPVLGDEAEHRLDPVLRHLRVAGH